ncbi:hypothetical protein BC829DRAFT_387360 [Chytridium lagenaria]|nr:hypothetical protein BC829DRAFT_387360 [Chytridium lagenaria]
MMDTSNEQTDVSEIIFITGVAVSFAAFLLAFCAVVYCCKGKAKGFRRYEAEQEAQRSRNTCATYKLKAQWKGLSFETSPMIVGFVLEISALMTLSQSPFFTRIFISAVVIGVISAFIAFVCRCSALSFEYSHSHLELQITRVRTRVLGYFFKKSF